jgi:hypothetical protein
MSNQETKNLSNILSNIESAVGRQCLGCEFESNEGLELNCSAESCEIIEKLETFLGEINHIF